MNPLYLPKTLRGKLHWLSEEVADLSAAINKTQRVADELGISIEEALCLYNPCLPEQKRESNRAWIHRELQDVAAALARLHDDPFMQKCISGNRECGYAHSETFTCSKCKKLVCWCAGGNEDELCASCFVQRKRAQAKANRQARAKKKEAHVRKTSGKKSQPPQPHAAAKTRHPGRKKPQPRSRTRR